jgi:hypothetical protein
MAGKEQGPGQGGIVEGYKKLNEVTRNIAIGVAVVAAVVGAEALAAVALLSAGVDQAQISVIDRLRNWGKKAQPRQVFP